MTSRGAVVIVDDRCGRMSDISMNSSHSRNDQEIIMR